MLDGKFQSIYVKDRYVDKKRILATRQVPLHILYSIKHRRER